MPTGKAAAVAVTIGLGGLVVGMGLLSESHGPGLEAVSTGQITDGATEAVGVLMDTPSAPRERPLGGQDAEREEVQDTPSSLYDFESHVRGMPVWSASTDEFEAKYAGFTLEELKRAETLISQVLREEQEPWIQQRMELGDFIDVSNQKGERRPSRTDLRLRTWAIRQVPRTDGEVGVKSMCFEFYEDEYPLIDYRARESIWLTNKVR